MLENEAIVRLKQGDVRGLEILVKTYQLKAVRAAYLIVGDRALAEDVVEDAFLRVYERIGQFDPLRFFEPWFLRIVVNIARRCLCRAARLLAPSSSISASRLAHPVSSSLAFTPNIQKQHTGESYSPVCVFIIQRMELPASSSRPG
jgi:RNA polymerase sigma-70 factor (ECF subfamily)